MPIVGAIDRNEKASAIVEHAATLGVAFDEPVRIVHVLGRDEFVELERTNVNQTGEAIPIDDIVAMAEEIAAGVIEEVGVDAEPVGLVGDPADEIVGYAADQGAEYVVLAGRKRSPVGKAIFGSVVQSVLLNAEQPVVSLRVSEEG